MEGRQEAIRLFPLPGLPTMIILGYLYTGAKKTISPQFVKIDFRLFLPIFLLYFPQPQQHIPNRPGTKFNLVPNKTSVGHSTCPSQYPPPYFCNPSAFVILEKVGLIGLTVSFSKKCLSKNFFTKFFQLFMASYLSFLSYLLFIGKHIIMENNHKRTSKSPSPETRQKISRTLQGRPKSQNTKDRISSSLKDY